MSKKEETIEEVRAKLVKAEAIIEKGKQDAIKAKADQKEKEEQAEKERKEAEEAEKNLIYLEVSHRAIDTDGEKTTQKHESKGSTIEEVLDNLELPEGLAEAIAVPVNIVLRKGDNVLPTVRITPKKARLILGEKDTHDLEAMLENL